MRKQILLIAALIAAMPLAAQEKHLAALFGYSVFYRPDTDQPYVETYLDFDANTLNFGSFEEGSYRATVSITLTVKRGDSLAYVKKYNLHSPASNRQEKNHFTFVDLRRFALSNGLYDLRMELKDSLSKDAPIVLTEKIVVLYEKGKPAISNLLLISSATETVRENMLSRGGYDMVPYIDDFLPADRETIFPYFEIYNLDRELKGGEYAVRLSVEQKETGRRVGNIGTELKHSASKPLRAVYAGLDIKGLPSGNYNLVAEVSGGDGAVLLRKRLGFMRSNPGADPSSAELTEDAVAASFASTLKDDEQLGYFIDALYPISSPDEIATAQKLTDSSSLQEKQTYFYRFWIARDPIAPADAWREYEKRLDYVKERFSYPLTPGYRTERGRVYLQYGPPDYIRDEKNFVSAKYLSPGIVVSSQVEASAEATTYVNASGQGTVHYLPYQLWRYNMLPGDDPNRVFLFWDEFRSGFYKLLNSNARGELRTAFWERVLSQNQLEENEVGAVGEQFERGF